MVIEKEKMVLFDSMMVDDCQLNAERIDIWEFSLNAYPKNAWLLLTTSEQERAQRFYFKHHQQRFISAHAMLRLILARYLNEEPQELVLDTSPYGKPILHSESKLEFNLSHSKDLALVAIGQQFPLGVDLEFFSARPYNNLAANLYSPLELNAFLNLKSSLRPLAFFHIWAQKEAFIKACGLGLRYPTESFTVSVLPSGEQILFDSLHQCTWKITSFMPVPACSAAICHSPHIKKIRYIRVQASWF